MDVAATLRNLQCRLLALGTSAVMTPPISRKRPRLMLQLAVGAGIGLAAIAAFKHFCIFSWDASGRSGGSLPFGAYVTVRGMSYERGDLVSFHWNGGYRYPAGTRMVKAVWGLPGDPIVREGRKVFVAGRYAGIAHEQNATGTALPINAAKSVPPGHVYVYASHPDSLDSRYDLVGFVPFSAIEGKTYAFGY